MTNKEVNIENNNHSYLHSLEIDGINCFKDKQTLDLSDGNGNYSPWTIILGDNGTGKTTLLKALDSMQPVTDARGIGESVTYPSRFFHFFNKYKQSEIKLFINLNNEIISFSSPTIELNGVNFKSHLGSINNFLLSYGASRRMNRKENFVKENFTMTSLFDESIELINAEEWFLQKEMISLKADQKTKKKFQREFQSVKNILIDILPDVNDIRVKPINETNLKLLLEVQTSFGWVNLRDLSFGYQTLTALIVDIASKMMEQYQNSDNPLEEPVIILIDEIDLHLHPKWQRIVIDKLSENFPKAQFIATSHSPLIVQAAQDKGANIVVCRKEGDKVIIDNNPDEVKGWRIDQILTSDLFEADSSRSIATQENIDNYISLKGKKDLSPKEKNEFDKLIPKVKTAFSESVLDEKLLQFTEKYLK
ncbi:ATP-binding protein [Flavobacterium sp.]|uniref:AAA family ATPase n=1 Tax=Flavobacterium sp. TaxID=239 RepID=UPI00286C7650|nr:ATP-binding protein [Flavobacterium sp.]